MVTECLSLFVHVPLDARDVGGIPTTSIGEDLLPILVVLHLGIPVEESLIHGRAVLRGEEVDLGRNASTAAEVQESRQLRHGLTDHVADGTRPVEEDDETMVLLVLLDGEAVEDVLAELVLGELTGGDATRLARRSTGMVTSSTLDLEPLDHQFDIALVGIGHALESLESRSIDASGISGLGVAVVARVELAVAESHEVLDRNDHLARIDATDGDDLLGVVRIHKLLNAVRHRIAGADLSGGELTIVDVHLAALAALARLCLARLSRLAIVGIVLSGLSGAVALSLTIATLGRTIAVLLLIAIGGRTILLILAAVLIITAAAIGGLVLGVLTLASIGLLTLALVRLLGVLVLLLTLAVGITLGIVVVLVLILLHGEEVTGDGNHILEATRTLAGRIDAVEDGTLGIGERNRHAAVDADLVVEVDAVDEGHLRNVALRDLEDVHDLMHVLVPRDEVSTKTRELALDHALNARILNDIDVVLSNTRELLAADLLSSRLPTHGRSVLRVGNLMTHKHVVHDLLALPHGEDEGTRSEVECRALHVRIVNNAKVLTGEKAREDAGAGGRGRGNGLGRAVHSGIHMT